MSARTMHLEELIETSTAMQYLQSCCLRTKDWTKNNCRCRTCVYRYAMGQYQVLAAAGLPIATPPGTADLTINTLAVKLPALWPDNPNKWFLYCEGKFRLHNFTKQQTMFDHCIQAMSAEQSDVVMDLMERGPSPTCISPTPQH